MTGLRVLMINPLETRGGEERVVLDLVHGLTRSGHEVGVVCSPDTSWRTELAGAPLHAASVAGGAWTYTKAVRAAVREFRPSIVHAHGAHPGVLGRLGSAGLRVPLVWTVHLHPEWNSPKVRASFAFRSALKGVLAALDPVTSMTVFVSDALAERFGEFAWRAPRPRTVIRNGIDTQTYRPDPEAGRRFRAEHGLPADGRLVGMVARLTPRKGVHLLCEAMQQLTSERVTCVVAGEGEDRARIEATRDRLGLGERFRLLGQIPDIPPFLSALDLGVLPSSAEGLPLSVMEMLSAGVPVLLSEIPEHTDFQVAGQAARTFPLGDPSVLARAIDAIFEGPLDPELGATARRAALEYFSRDRMVREHEELYALLAQTSGSS